jgi:hypothetical protein
MTNHRLRTTAAVRRHRSAVLLLAASSLGGLVLGACGNSAAGHRQAARFTIPGTSAPPGVTTPPAPELSASNTLQTPTCTAAELKLTITQATDTLGQLNFTLSVTNAGQIACFLRGFPNVHALGSNGSSEGVAAEMVGLTTPSPVALHPGLSAIADLHVDNGQASGARCQRRQLHALEVRLGNSSVGRVHVQGRDDVCHDGLPSEFGVSAWTPGPDADAENDNDG